MKVFNFVEIKFLNPLWEQLFKIIYLEMYFNIASLIKLNY